MGKILAGIAIIVAAFYTGGAALSAAGSITAGTVGTIALGIGASLILGGITQLLTPTPNFNQDNSAETAGSTLFAGNAVAVAQGGAVGLVYGRALVAPMPVCISFSNEDVTLVNGQRVTTSAGTTSYTQVDLQGGGYQWTPVDDAT